MSKLKQAVLAIGTDKGCTAVVNDMLSQASTNEELHANLPKRDSLIRMARRMLAKKKSEATAMAEAVAHQNEPLGHTVECDEATENGEEATEDNKEEISIAVANLIEGSDVVKIDTGDKESGK